jgi:hypothetical protein
MIRHVLFAAVIFFVVTGAVLADAGFPRLGSPDLENSSSAANTFFGVSLAALFSFGGYWAIRNPWAALAVCFLGVGTISILLSLLCLLTPYTLLFIPPFFGVGAVLLFFGGRWIIRSRVAFVGRNLVFMLLSLAAAVAVVVSLSQLTWTNPREEERIRRQQQRETRDRAAKEKEAKGKEAKEKEADEK